MGYDGADAAIPADIAIDHIQMRLANGTLFSSELIDFLQSSEARIRYKSDDIPWFFYCLICGNRAQRQQLAEQDFLNRPFVAYYKAWSDSTKKIAFSQFRTALPGRQTPHVTKSHTVLTMALRLGPRYFSRRPENFIDEMLSLKNSAGQSLVDLDRLFTHEENEQPHTTTNHSLLTYLMELITLLRQPENRAHRINVLRSLLLNENPNYGIFAHNPQAICYQYETLFTTYEMNALTFLVGRCLPDLACFYGYLFPEATFRIKQMDPHDRPSDPYCQAIYDKQAARPLHPANFDPIFMAEGYKDIALPPDMLLYILDLQRPQASASCAALQLTPDYRAYSLEKYSASSPDRRFRQAANRCAQLTIQTWRYTLSPFNPLLLTWLQLRPLDRYQLFEYISEVIYTSLHNGTNRIEEHNTEDFRHNALQLHQARANTPNIIILSTALTTEFSGAILANNGDNIIFPPLPHPNRFANTLADQMFEAWFNMQTKYTQQAMEIPLYNRLKKDRTNLLKLFLLSCQFHHWQEVENNWRFFTHISLQEPLLNWPTLQAFKARYGY